MNTTANINARYALRDANGFWSTGDVWKRDSNIDLLTGAQADEMKTRHPEAEIVDVIVHHQIQEIWLKGFSSVLPPDYPGRSTAEQRTAARAAGAAAMVAAGYPATF